MSEKTKPVLVKKEDGLFAKLKQIFQENNGVITFHFEKKNTFRDYKGDIKNVPVTTEIEETARKWSQSQPINKEIFFDSRGKRLHLEQVVQLFRDLCEDKGAKYFTI
jgi:hypothetical protein